MNRERVLIAGVGNIFLGDDAFGCEVAQQLAACELAAEVRLVDFGIRGLDLGYALLDGYEAVVMIDAAPRGGQPGNLYVLEIPTEMQPTGAEWPAPLFEAHRLDPAAVIRFASAMGGKIGRLLLVGCEPSPLEDFNDALPGLSAPVQAAVPRAVELVRSLVGELLGNQAPGSQASEASAELQEKRRTTMARVDS